MFQKYIYVKLTKEWGGFQVDDVVRFGISKGERIINQGIGVKVKKQPAVNDPPPEVKISPVVETADAPPPLEKAVVIPLIKEKKIEQPAEPIKKDKEKGGAD